MDFCVRSATGLIRFVSTTLHTSAVCNSRIVGSCNQWHACPPLFLCNTSAKSLKPSFIYPESAIESNKLTQVCKYVGELEDGGVIVCTYLPEADALFFHLRLLCSSDPDVPEDL